MSAKADAFCTRPTDTVGQESLSSQNKSIFFYGGGASSGVSKWMTTLPVQPFVLLIIILLFYISLGKFIEGMAMLLLTIPFVFSILQGFGYERLCYKVDLTKALVRRALTSIVNHPDT